MEMLSINSASLEFEKDRRTLTRALAGVKPDGKQNGQPRWKISTVFVALSAHEARVAGPAGAEPSARLKLVDRIEAHFAAFDTGLERLLAEPNLKKRRKLDKKLGVGRTIGALDSMMREACAADTEQGAMTQIVGDRLIGGIISHFLTACEYWPARSEFYKVRTEGNARTEAKRGA